MTFNETKTVVAIGKFDGLHQGHKELLITAARLAAKAGLVSVCYIIASKDVKTLITESKREEIIQSYGIGNCLVQELTADFMSMSPESFVNDILKCKLNCAHVVVGYNFRFGKGRCADANELKAICSHCGILCTVIPEVKCTYNNLCHTVSSSRVRECLSLGDVRSASAILGRPYSITGVVTEGKKIGRTLDFPTANIIPEQGLIIPGAGVYATGTAIDGIVYKSITNIGSNPTVNAKGNITVETHIPGYSGDLYGREITVEFTDRIRGEIKFASVAELREQIQNDIAGL